MSELGPTFLICSPTQRILVDGNFDFGIMDRDNRLMAEWEGGNVFPGAYEPAQVKSFSLPNVVSCDRPASFTAVATIGHYSQARLKHLTYDQVTCRNGRLTG
jgi:hypothetical protein